MDGTFDVTLDRREHYQFDVHLGDAVGTTLLMDEPEPLGDDQGPNAARVLAAAIGNCLSASLLFCLEKARIDVANVKTRVRGSLVRNEAGKMRLGPIQVTIEPTVLTVSPARLSRCLELFEDFCVVTQSVRAGVDVAVEVVVPEHAGQVLT